MSWASNFESTLFHDRPLRYRLHAQKNPGPKIEPGNWHWGESFESMDDIARVGKFHRPRGVLKTDPKTHTAVGIAEATRVEVGRDAGWLVTRCAGGLVPGIVNIPVNVGGIVSVAWRVSTVGGLAWCPINHVMTTVDDVSLGTDPIIRLDAIAVRRGSVPFLCPCNLGQTKAD